MFLPEPPHSAAVEAAYDKERSTDGYVMNNTRLWSYRPDVNDAFIDLRILLREESALTDRELAVLVTAAASAREDSYCALAWGQRLAGLAGEPAAVAVIQAETAPSLTPRETALAAWARVVVAVPNATTAADVAQLRDSGLTDREIFEATCCVAFRLAFSTVDNALGAEPDLQLAQALPAAVREAVSFGRPPATFTD